MSDQPTKAALEKAYQAGRALPSIDWDPAIQLHDDLGKGTGIEPGDEAEAKLRTPGVHHCPFAEGDPQRDAWLRGLRDRLKEPTEDPATIVAAIDKELKR